MTTAASRPGGKFGGKFSGRGKTTLTPGSSGATGPTLSSSTSNNSDVKDKAKDDSMNGKDSQSITMEMINAQRSKIKRHEVFDKLDEAESIVLDILNIAKDTTKGLEFLASAHDINTDMGIKVMTSEPLDSTSSTKNNSNSDDKNQNQNQSMDIDVKQDQDTKEENQEKKMKDEESWKKKIRHDGKLYMQKLKRIHDLLTPHSDLVVNYDNVRSQEQNTEQNAVVTPPASSTSSLSKTPSTTANNDENDKKDKTKNNMYASRLETRLAIDKKNLMNDLVQLEKKMFHDEMESLKKSMTTITNGSVKSEGDIKMAIANENEDNSNKRNREE
jgi:hypothetical protein